MDEATRFLILSLDGENYALTITRLVEILTPRQIQRDPNLSEIFEGKTDYRGRLIPVINLRKVFRAPSVAGSALLIIKSARGQLGIMVDAVTEIFAAEHPPVPMPDGVISPTIKYFQGVLRYRDSLVLLLNEDGLVP